MIEDKITYEIKDNGCPIRSMTVTGTYNLNVGIDAEPHAMNTDLHQFHELITASIERQVLHDMYGLSFAKSFDEQQKDLVVEALARLNMEARSMGFGREDMTKPFSNQYGAFRIREDLIYQLRAQA